MPRDFTASGGSEAPLRSTGHAWSTISQMASPVPREEMVAKETPHAIVIESQQPLIVSDTGAETRWPERMAMIRNDGIGSFCVLPLTTIHTRLGTLGFARRDRATYTDAEVQFMGEVAKLVAVAIENAMAFGEIGRLKDKLAEERLYLESEIRNEQSFERSEEHTSE